MAGSGGLERCALRGHRRRARRFGFRDGSLVGLLLPLALEVGQHLRSRLDTRRRLGRAAHQRQALRRAEPSPSVEPRAQVLAYLEREREEQAYERAVPEPEPPRSSSMTTQSASLEPEPGRSSRSRCTGRFWRMPGAGFELKYPADVFAPKAWSPGGR